MSFRFKHFFFNAFRELFLYHHSSLEFRAKLFAAPIAADLEADTCEYAVVEQAAKDIYGDGDRAELLVLTVKEYVKKVIDNNGLGVDELIEDIIRDLKNVPRYAKKIDTQKLRPLLACQNDEMTRIYQERMLALFERLKREYEESDQPR